MVISKIDPLINDGEINYLADLFLACFRFERSTFGYRCFKNAVVLFSRGLPLGEMYERLAECAGTDRVTFMRELKCAVDSLDEPMADTFNRTYAQADELCITMRPDNTVNYVIPFLGTAFLYLIIRNYNKYEYVRLDKPQ